MGTTREHLSERCAEEILRRFEKIWGMDRVQRHQDLGRRRFENDTFYSQITITMKSDNRRLLVTCIQKVATLTKGPRKGSLLFRLNATKRPQELFRISVPVTLFSQVFTGLCPAGSLGEGVPHRQNAPKREKESSRRKRLCPKF